MATTTPNNTPDSTPETDPTGATLRLEVQDAGDGWATQATLHNASPAELAEMLAAGVAQAIQDVVEAVGEVQDASVVDQATVALDMFRLIPRAMLHYTLDGLPVEVRLAATGMAMAAEYDEDDDDDQ